MLLFQYKNKQSINFETTNNVLVYFYSIRMCLELKLLELFSWDEKLRMQTFIYWYPDRKLYWLCNCTKGYAWIILFFYILMNLYVHARYTPYSNIKKLLSAKRLAVFRQDFFLTPLVKFDTFADRWIATTRHKQTLHGEPKMRRIIEN